MNFGATIFNSGGNTVVDSAYRNLVFRQKNTLTFTPTRQQSGNTIVDVDRKTVVLQNAVNPVIAIKAGSGVGITGLTVSGSTYTWTISSNDAASCTVYVFDTAEAPVSTFGMQVLNESGELVFSSDNVYMKVVDFFTVSYSSSSWPTVTRSYSSGDYAVAVGFPRTIGLIGGSVQTDKIQCTNTSVSIGFSVVDITSAVKGIGFLIDPVTVPVLTLNVEGL